MSEIDDTQHGPDCTCSDCVLARPHLLAQRLSDLLIDPSGNPTLNRDINQEMVSLRIGDPSIEDGSDSIYVGDIEKGLPHGRGLLLTILAPKPENYDESKIDQVLLQSLMPDSGVTSSMMHRIFMNSGILLHESEYPFLTMEGTWQEGKLQRGDSFRLDIENCTPVLQYSGQWENNIPSGKGVIFDPDWTYSGGLKFGQKHGIGKESYADGRSIEGEWNEGEYHGFMKFNIAEGVINEQEFYKGEEISPLVSTTFEEGGKLFSNLSADIEDITVGFLRSWDDSRKLIHSYVPKFELDDMTSLRPVPANEMDLAKNIHETADFGENIPVMPPQTIEKFWIFDESEYVVKDPSSEILGWVKRIEGKPGQASSASKVFIVFPDLSYFQGSVGEDFLPNGSGIYTFPGNYSKISGDWKDGEISKGGIYVSNTILYYGNFSNGMPTLEGEYYRTGELIRKDKAKTNEEKEELRQQLVERIGSNVWSRKSNFIDWDSTFSKSLSSIISAINFDSEASELMHLVNADESSSLEFKSSVWATYNNATGEQIKDAKKNLSTEDSIVKTIAAFCNTDGGTLVIGVQDRPEKKVIGIDGDLQYSGKQKDMESFQNSLSEVIRKATNNDSIIGTIVDIRVEDFDGEKICIVGVKQKQWVWVDLKNDKRGAPGKSIFFVRSGPQTVQLSPESAHEWRREKESTP